MLDVSPARAVRGLWPALSHCVSLRTLAHAPSTNKRMTPQWPILRPGVSAYEQASLPVYKRPFSYAMADADKKAHDDDYMVAVKAAVDLQRGRKMRIYTTPRIYDAAHRAMTSRTVQINRYIRLFPIMSFSVSTHKAHRSECGNTICEQGV